MRLEWRLQLPGRETSGPQIQTSLTHVETLKLGALARGARVAEIGTGFGYSAISMALFGATQVVTADPHRDLAVAFGNDSLTAAKAYAKSYGVTDKVQFRHGRSRDVFDVSPTTGEKYDGIFVDGDHGYEAVLEDCLLADRLVPRGWIAFHDYGELTCPEVSAAVDRYWGRTWMEAEAEPFDVVDTLYVRQR